ncbi:hypothetical protein QBC34DRAFT_223121 [Podospora aff. communis PSN243]|uniref:AAA+ ATPase domain-containing protein n=1 Tax=Podospora aff. communis PSN243 TaxID=3040156 RepID=A0AAV9G5W0_9PEZI|nr:hypothetical protein QBC34DRAFT_223121 [Podospora aff. communis PSN243]
MQPPKDSKQAPLRLEDLVSSVLSAENIANAQANPEEGRPPGRSYPPRKQLPVGSRLSPSVRECDWKRFKTYAPDEQRCIIDTLVAGNDLPLRIWDQGNERGVPPPRERGFSEAGDLDDERWIHRVRVRSAAVLKVLSVVSGEWLDVTKSHTFMRPFGMLILHHEQVKECVEALEGELEAGLSVVAEGEGGDGDEDEGEGTGEEHAARVLRELHCYIDFVEHSLLPDYHQFENASDIMTRVRYDDLWYLFRPGELIYVCQSPTHASTRGKFNLQDQAKHRIMRVAELSPHTARITGHGFYRGRYYAGSDGPQQGDGMASGCKVECYFLDFDGENFVPEWLTITFLPFPGKTQVGSLYAYPLRFAESSEELRSAGIATGRKVLECIERKRMAFDGPCLLYEPNNQEATAFKGEALREPERYDGEVYIDIKEAIKTRPYWSLRSHGLRLLGNPRLTLVVEDSPVVEHLPVQLNGEGLPSKPPSAKQHGDLVVQYDATMWFQGSRHVPTDTHISKKGGTPLASFPLNEEDLALVPSRIYAYLVRYRVFMAVDVQHMQPIPLQPAALDTICMEDTAKKMLRLAVSSYFRQGKDAAFSGSPVPRRKRRGVVVMIQGSPGSGKTATVEAVAHAYNKPLFMLEAGDLVSETEETMMMFEVAKAWDAVLLLDDADVLLSRSRHDSRVNQQAARFLRILDTFPGLIFLTTSHPAALDETVKSRVHVNICLKDLTLTQTRTIFQLNLDRIREEERHESEGEALSIADDQLLQFAEEHYNTHAANRWNGRQIRNMVNMAADLARCEAAPGTQPQLNVEHLRTAAEMMREPEDTSAGLVLRSALRRGEGFDEARFGVGRRRNTASSRRGDGEEDDDGGSEVSLDNGSPRDEEVQSIAQWSVVAK